MTTPEIPMTDDLRARLTALRDDIWARLDDENRDRQMIAEDALAELTNILAVAATRSDRERLLSLLADFDVEPDELAHAFPAPGPNDVILGATDASGVLAQFHFDDAGKFLRLQVREP